MKRIGKYIWKINAALLLVDIILIGMLIAAHA